MGQMHPERCSELFMYIDLVYRAFTTHGRSARWRQDKQLHRRLVLRPDIGWGMKATDAFVTDDVAKIIALSKKEAGKFRLTHHLSFPKLASVNYGISKESASVSF